jgi:pSer/pThr/pTyr-binding forkhead associated (FHA) protein
MAKLTINVPGMPASEIELKPGANRFGRSRNNDVQIAHPSVSSVHCEIVDTDGALRVRDLGSTNGISLDGQPVQESPLQPGQILRMGEVEIRFGENAQDAMNNEQGIMNNEKGLKVAPVEASAVSQSPPVPRLISRSDSLPVGPPPQAPRLRPAPARPARREVSFYKSIPGAFVFPFRGNGLILLVSGTVFFVLVNFLGGAAGMVGIGLGVFSCGYLFAFLQSIITTSGMGEEEPPSWPDFDNWTESGLGPFLQLLGILVVCLGPAFLYSRFASHVQFGLAAGLWIAGLLYLPMALLAVAIYDNLAALNPVLILLSIWRVPLPYAATCSVLGLLLLMMLGSNWVDENLNVPLLPNIVDEFLLLYTLMVVARVAGLLYFTTKDRLCWSLSGK